MNKRDVIEALGQPDRILPAGKGMTSLRWKCGKCKKISDFPQPVRPPAPCVCGSIFFEKIKPTLQ